MTLDGKSGTLLENISKLIKLEESYYKLPGNSVGGRLHVVLEDMNYTDSLIELGKTECEVFSDKLGVEICELLLTIPFIDRQWMHMPFPLWNKEYEFDYCYDEIEGIPEIGDTVLVKECAAGPAIFVIQDIVDDVHFGKVACVSSFKFTLKNCIKIEVTQDLN